MREIAKKSPNNLKSSSNFARSMLVVLLPLVILIVLAATISAPTLGFFGMNTFANRSTNATTSPNQAGKLYVISHIPRTTDDITMGAIAGRVTVLDMTTQKELLSFPTGVDVNAVPSPDGKTLYIAAVDAPPEGGIGHDYLVAINTESGDELWRTELKDRAKGETGTPGMLLSHDGQWLYYYSYPWLELEKHAAGTYWISTVNTTTGEVLPTTVALPNCFNTTLLVSPDNTMLYATCFGTDDIRAINVRENRVAYRVSLPGSPGKPERAWQPGGVFATLISPDGRTLYVVTDQANIHRVDTATQRITKSIDLNLLDTEAKAIDSVSLSPRGERLLVGIKRATNDATHTSIVAEFDTHTWELLRLMPLSENVLGMTYLIGDDQIFLYGVQAPSFPMPANSIIGTNPVSNAERTEITRTGEEILRMFIVQ
jgi:hypothetical protein